MPSQTLTITLNYNQSKKATIVLPVASQIEAVLQEARNKFRNKALCSVFVKGGRLLSSSDTLGLEEREVWVSKGEPYAGPPSIDKPTRKDGIVADVRVIAEHSFIDKEAIKQLEAVALLTGVRLAVGMPDLHPGNRFPIGCAIVADGIYPALIGSDIGCGIALYTLSASVPNIKPERLASKLRGLDSPWLGDVPAWLARYGITEVSEFDRDSLGTVGGGNHFAEVCTVEQIVDPNRCQLMGLTDSALYLLVHTGSRGLGGSILRSQTQDNSNPYILADSPGLDEYLARHDYAVTWARANRDLVAFRIRECLFPPLQENQPDNLPQGLPNVGDLGKIIDITHNSVVRSNLSLESGQPINVWIHRKGATPTDKGVVPCPGSRGDFTWLLMPSGDGEYNAQSLAHGAGRLHPRSAAVLRKGPSGNSLRTTALGSQVICSDPDLLVEERPEAYKGVEMVVDDMIEKQIATGVMVLRPFVTFKVGEK